MNDTLYREATTHEIIERTDVIYLAVLPVEIDYEAAIDEVKKWQRQMRSTLKCCESPRV